MAFGDPANAPGWSVDGGFADKFLTDVTGLMTLPGAVDFEQAATATDAGQTAYGAVMGAGKLQADERVGIVGLGGLGADRRTNRRARRRARVRRRSEA